MELKQWKLEFAEGWDVNFKKFNDETKRRILKKFEHMKQPLQGRGLHSSRHQVEEVGQNRIAFIQEEETGTKYIRFVGNHKQYKKWYSG